MSISQNTLDTLQDAPQPNMQPDEFNLKAFAFAAVLYTLGLEINETVATLNQASTTSESGDTLTISLGAKNLTVEAGKSFAVGMSVRIADTVTGTRWMNGDVTAYDPGTGNLSVNVSAIQGSGNANVWTISQSFGGLTTGSVDTDKLADDAVILSKIDPDTIRSLSVPVGSIIICPGTTAPDDYIVVPTAPTNLSREMYPLLHAWASAQGYPWGAGDGATTFGIPWLAPDRTILQANGNVATTSAGEVIEHGHTNVHYRSDLVGGGGSGGLTNLLFGTQYLVSGGGGSANLAAGTRFLICQKYQ